MRQIWRDNFKSYSLRVGFKMSLSRLMVEYLSAVSDDVAWNPAFLGPASADLDNFITIGRALEKRGLIVRKPSELNHRHLDSLNNAKRFDFYNWNYWQLTPAGEHVVQLLKLADVYVEADVATEKRGRAAIKI